MRYNDLDVNAYNFYIKEQPYNLINKGWTVVNYTDDDNVILESAFPIYYTDSQKKPSVFCRLVWYSKNDPVIIQVYTNTNTVYSTFFREKYNSSSYISSLHKNILRYINKFNTIAKRKEN